MDHALDAICFAVVMVVPVLVWIVSRPWVWKHLAAILRPLGVRVWRQVVVDDSPDPATLLRWAQQRLARLRADLERVRRLLLDDEWMSGTRQVGNRLAYERLVVDVREAERQVPAAALEVPAAPSPVSAPRFTFAAPSTQPAVEMIEFGPSGRWL